MKRLVVFDLDGTLAESKSAIGAEMGALLARLLDIVHVAVISGGGWSQFERQLLSQIGSRARLTRLSLLPVCGTRFYEYNEGWTLRYADDLTDGDKAKITEALHQVATDIDGPPARTWGDVIEDRGSQITYSALGQQAPLAAKKTFDPDFAKRTGMKAKLDSLIPEFSVRLGGTTSIDITKSGVDKAYGIRKLSEILAIEIGEMIFVGDALLPGGNDHAVQAAGVESISTRDPNETRGLIAAMLACAGGLGLDAPASTDGHR
ncbi:MAG: HAD-IIB family hydrolase [Actinomycetota bacterium]|nr:HAD-IIB family hydrolase [Actinomycetota bacterium]